MLDAAAKTFFHTLAQSRLLARLASRYGMAGSQGFARRFVAGETVDEAIGAIRALQAQGLTSTLDLLGESVSTLAEADAAARDYIGVLEAVVAAGVERNLSLKLTQLGLDIDRATCVDHLRRILDRATPHDFFVRIDMESSAYTQATLDVFETLWQQGYRHIGMVLQSALRRSEEDARALNAMGARVRLVKGAYNEPKSVAYQAKADVDAAYVRIATLLLSEGTYPAIATHDPAMLAAVREYATGHEIATDRFEFQMLYGIRRDLQAALHADGYAMRVYTPFGTHWFQYFMRRLGERPANVGFVLRGILTEDAEEAGRPSRAPCVSCTVHVRHRDKRLPQPPQYPSASCTSASRHASTSSSITYSVVECSPAPPGPNSTEGIPARPSTAASVQNEAPTIGAGRPIRSVAATSCRESSWPAGSSYGGRLNGTCADATNVASSRPSAARIASTSVAAASGASPGTVRRSICNRQRSG